MDFQSVLDSLRYPIWQAPTSSLAGPGLCTAVSKAGGMGSMAMTWTEPARAAEEIEQVRRQTENPFFVNFALAFPPDSLDASLEAGAPIVTFSWGDPAPYLKKVRDANAKIGIQVTNSAGAQRAIDQRADFLICQGNEAGGHVQSNTSLWELLPRIVETARGIPVIAAGGICTGALIAKALALGAKGTILGTRFLATQESRAHPDYKKLLVEARGETALTVCFDGGWASPHRVLRNTTLEAWEASGSPIAGERPGEGETIATSGDGEPVLRYGSAAPNAGYTGNIEAMCLYSGTGVAAIDDIPTVSQLMERLWRECAEEQRHGLTPAHPQG
jgi:nitronate monooxygenase